MFERFTGRARHVIVIAQDAARVLDHNYIGTEHLLLGLIREDNSIAGIVLANVGLTYEGVRADIEAATKKPKGKHAPKGHIPFTPRAKKVLELALREALQLGHNYIGTEHILLGVMREGEGLGAEILRKHDLDFSMLRTRILDAIPITESNEARGLRRWLRPRSSSSGPEIRTTTAIDASLEEARRIAGNAAVGSHHLLLATLNDPASAAAKALTTLGIDLDRAREALRNVEVAGTSDELPEEAGRRQLTLNVTEHGLTLETADPVLVQQARAALRALSEGAERSGKSGKDLGVIKGDHPRATGFADVWQALNIALRQLADTPEQQPGGAGEQPRQATG
jgi:ATP-dependent Clp protease ATP-binding subunit ClpC